MRWESHVPGSYATEHIMIAAVQAMENLGYDVAEAEAMSIWGLSERTVAVADTIQ